MDAVIKDVHKRIDAVFAWVEQHGGDVNGPALAQSCDTVAVLASNARNIRTPMGVLGRGLFTLDYACALSGYHASNVNYLARLPCPGAADVRAYYERIYR